MWWTELAAHTSRLASELPDGLDIHPSAVIDSTAVIAGPVKIGARTQVRHGAFIEGPVEIGDDCMIGNMAMIRGATRIGDQTRIGFAAEIKQSLIGERVIIGPQCFIADSVLRDDVYLGAQVRTSNHRLDRNAVSVMADGELLETGMEKLGCLIEAGAALGIQVIILPGRIVAARSLIGPRVTIEKNLPSGHYRQSQSIVKISAEEFL